jgi:NAD(P)-dependent dehydrogenase (short-subunit alcohol dehydrogenase family)
MELRGSSALVTGAGRGIGRAVARRLAASGVSVTAVARTASDLETLVREITAEGGRAVAFPGDIRNGGVCSGAVTRAVEAHGRLQILVNNAGIGAHAPVVETSDEDWARILDTNLTAVFRLTRAALPHLTRGGGHVLMISSLAGQNPIAGMAAYCASKAALDHFAHCLMLEVRQQGVKVTTIAPGSVATGFGGERGDSASSWKLQPDDIADTVLDLLRMRDSAHSSRVEMRPLRPPTRA